MLETVVKLEEIRCATGGLVRDGVKALESLNFSLLRLGSEICSRSGIHYDDSPALELISSLESAKSELDKVSEIKVMLERAIMLARDEVNGK